MAELVFFSGTMDCGKSTLALQTFVVVIKIQTTCRDGLEIQQM